MKTFPKTFIPAVLVAALSLMLAGRATAQTFTTLHLFTTDPFPYTNTDGARPYDGLILSGNTLYGTTSVGGVNGSGTVFAINPNDKSFTNLYNFTANSLDANSDGLVPNGGLILSGGTLYGTAELGGTNAFGTVFAVNTNGLNFSTLHHFSNLDGSHPQAGLILSGNTLYGTTATGGANGPGTVFAISTNGMGFTNLYSFSAEATNALGIYTNFDGATPVACLVLSGNTLYGTAYNGGPNGVGTVFAISTNGMGFTNLYSFTGGNDGAHPQAGLLLSGNTLYGATASGGTNGAGAIFAINTNGMGFKKLYSFSSFGEGGPNNDGATPLAGLILSNNILYGTAYNGGLNGGGTVFAISTNGTGFTNLYSFTGGGDGFRPSAALILSSNTLYGTAALGGSDNLPGSGTVFSISLTAGAPKLNINLSGTNVIVSWVAAGYSLESTTNLASPNWITISGQNAVTNSITAKQQFYRLSQ
jgi:uncharacterized repeat protein (TIGR03803 family)